MPKSSANSTDNKRNSTKEESTEDFTEALEEELLFQEQRDNW